MKKIFILLLVLASFGLSFGFSNLENVSLNNINEIKQQEEKISNLIGGIYNICIGNKIECKKKLDDSILIFQLSFKERKGTNLVKSKYDFILPSINNCHNNIISYLKNNKKEKAIIEYNNCVYNNISNNFNELSKLLERYHIKYNNITLLNYQFLQDKLIVKKKEKVKEVQLVLFKLFILLLVVNFTYFMFYKIYKIYKCNKTKKDLLNNLNSAIALVNSIKMLTDDKKEIIGILNKINETKKLIEISNCDKLSYYRMLITDIIKELDNINNELKNKILAKKEINKLKNIFKD